MISPVATADLVGEHGAALRVCDPQFRSFGGRARFAGSVCMIRCFEDNDLVRTLLRTTDDGNVLVMDGGGSLRTALAGVDLGVLALGAIPRKSGKAGTGEVDVPHR